MFGTRTVANDDLSVINAIKKRRPDSEASMVDYNRGRDVHRNVTTVAINFTWSTASQACEASRFIDVKHKVNQIVLKSIRFNDTSYSANSFIVRSSDLHPSAVQNSTLAIVASSSAFAGNVIALDKQIDIDSRGFPDGISMVGTKNFQIVSQTHDGTEAIHTVTSGKVVYLSLLFEFIGIET